MKNQLYGRPSGYPEGFFTRKMYLSKDKSNENLSQKGIRKAMKQQNHLLRTRLTALLLALLCVLGLFPTTALAAGDTIRLTDFGMSGVAYQSDALGVRNERTLTFFRESK